MGLILVMFRFSKRGLIIISKGTFNTYGEDIINKIYLIYNFWFYCFIVKDDNE